MYEQNNLRVWASDIEAETLLQAERTARSSVVVGPVALMGDAHVGLGSTVGSVIATEGAVLPASIGVDIGCGLIGVETDLKVSDLPDSLDGLLPEIARSVPAGVGKGHTNTTNQADKWFAVNRPPHDLKDLGKVAMNQFGTLGAGNHFLELCQAENDTVWVILHSGSRGVGNKLATKHIQTAKKLARDLEIHLEDPDLAPLIEGTHEFEAYIRDMLWSQAYAYASRSQMMDAALNQVFRFIGKGKEVDRINSHHNFTQKEVHTFEGGVQKEVWLTRKGAVKADTTSRGIIPGSMGTRTYVISGLGNPLSYNSSPHGAGRRMSRGEAKRKFTVEDLKTQMKGITWLEGKAESLIDEIPESYKSIDQVMEDSKDLVRIDHTLRQLLNYKGC